MKNFATVPRSTALKVVRRAAGIIRSGRGGSSGRTIGQDEIDPREAYAGFAVLAVLLILEGAALYPIVCG
jgi:hypothetical protein